MNDRVRLRGASITYAAILGVSAAILLPLHGFAADAKNGDVEKVVAHAVRPMMERFGIPGMAVGVVTKGQNFIYDYGTASKGGRPVTRSTLFEIGSISKTFTATLASYAQIDGQLALTDMASKHLPLLRGSAFDHVSLVNLGTHTAGGLPLQVPDDVTNNEQLMAYFKNWKPAYAAGLYRAYANPSIGMLGMIAAKSMNKSFTALMEKRLFLPLGMMNTYLNVPKAQMENYAQGYTATDTPARMTPGVLALEAYGVRTTVGDLVRFVEANMHMLELDDKLQRAIIDTHTAYYWVGTMTQDLIWEQYEYPTQLQDFLAGNAAKIRLEANPATEIDPPLHPKDDVLINKTGSTNGFAAYVLFVPAKKLGVVMLANKSYPIEARVTAGYDILTQLDRDSLKQ